MKRILYIEGCKDGTVGGSHTCLYSMIINLDKQQICPVVVFYYDHIIAERLRSSGIETHIFKEFTPLNFGLIFKHMSPSLEKISRLFLPLQKVLNLFWFFLRPAIVYAWYLKQQNIDIVHLNNSINTNHEWMVAAKLAGVKIISHERGISEHLSKISKLLGNTLDLLICVSKVISNPLLRQGLSKSKTVVVYDGIDTSKIIIENNPEHLKRLYGIENHDPVIGVVGNIKAWKGQETVVRASALLKKTWPGIKCLLVGNTVDGDPYKEKLQQIIRELKIDNNIIFTGFQKNPADFMNIMDVVVHSSIEPEPFGMVNVEAMFLKKPVISTNIGGPTEIFENEQDGILIEPGNPIMLAQRISALLNDPTMRDNIGQAAHKSVINKFRISNTVNTIEDLYERLYDN